MANILKIEDSTDGFLSFDLRALLALVHPEGEHLAWYGHPMGEPTEITCEAGQEVANRINASEDAVPVSWQELTALAESIDQTIWGTFLGCRQDVVLGGARSLFLDPWHYLDRVHPAFYTSVEIALQAVDSSFWLVYAKSETLEVRIKAAFHEVTVLQVS